jgi:hypothetical protein
MKKALLVVFSLCFIVATTDAQRTLLDFEGGNDLTFFDNFNQGSGGYSAIPNPDQNTTNPSDSVGQFIEAPDGDPWAGFFFQLNDGAAPIDLSASSELCVDVWVSEAATLTYKVEEFDNDAGMLVAAYEPPIPVDITATAEWTTVCQSFVGTPVENNTNINRLVYIFNITSTPAADLTHFFDNAVQPGVSSTNELFRGELLRVYPNPSTHNIFFDTDGSPRTILVSDMMGRNIARYDDFAGNNIRVSEFAPGTYIMTFVDEVTGQIASARFVKK